MACGILAIEDGGTSRRADAHGAKLMEANPLASKALHAGCAIPFVQWILFRLTIVIGEEWHGSIHDAHVIDEENDDVRWCWLGDGSADETVEKNEECFHRCLFESLVHWIGGLLWPILDDDTQRGIAFFFLVSVARRLLPFRQSRTVLR